MKKRTVGVLLAAFFAMALTGCGDKQPQPGEVKGYDKGEEYLSIWVHSIEDTEEGQCYRKSVDAFNKKYDGKYFADIEFIPRNDSGGGYSDKIVYLDSIIQQGTYNNKLYALGAMESSVGLYYNKDILAEAGVEVPDADHPWTWSEFTEVLKKVQPVVEKKKGYALDMTFPTGEATIYYYAPFFWSNGGNMIDSTLF